MSEEGHPGRRARAQAPRRLAPIHGLSRDRGRQPFFKDKLYFGPGPVNIPGIYPWVVGKWPGPEEDHAFHEFAELSVTDDPPLTSGDSGTSSRTSSGPL